jgi:hypothetical protein
MCIRLVRPLVLLAATAAAGPVRTEQPSEAALVREVAGCYRLMHGTWSGRTPTAAADYPLPAGFRLLTRRSEGRRYLRYLAEPPRLHARGAVAAEWQPDPATRGVTVRWGSDMVGLVLDLRVRGDSLAGTAETFADFHGPPDVHMPVLAVRTTCRAGSPSRYDPG